jgi:hypothetical protein
VTGGNAARIVARWNQEVIELAPLHPASAPGDNPSFRRRWGSECFRKSAAERRLDLLRATYGGRLPALVDKYGFWRIPLEGAAL